MSYSKCRNNLRVKKSALRGVHFFIVKMNRLFFSFREYAYLCFSLYIRYPRLACYDVIKFFYSMVHNPYRRLHRSSKSSLLVEGNVYGETPWSTLEKISKEFGITSKEIVYDLGCGLGKVCLWFSHVVGCHVIGVDNQRAFVRFASTLNRFLSARPPLFMVENFCQTRLAHASCVYFYGSSYSRRVLREVLQILKGMAPGGVVISLSFPLESIADGQEYFFVEKSCVVRLPWGKTVAYKNIRKDY